MNYELCKELKDAGFPQGIEGPVMSDDMEEVVSPETHSYMPDLSELLEACGDRIDELRKMHFGWVARTDGDTWLGEGSTPEEAVARLWLALNKKV